MKDATSSRGYYGSDEYYGCIRDIVEQEAFYFSELANPFQDIVRWRKLYLAKRKDPRDPQTEKWRANVFVPYPYSGVETRVAALSDILNSSDPPIQAEGVHDNDVANARRHERLLDYTLRKNHWRLRLIEILRDMSIDGTALVKLFWNNLVRKTPYFPTKQDLTAFEDAVNAAIVGGATDPPDPVSDPDGFEVWRTLVNQSGKGQVPEPPLPGVRSIMPYEGPLIQRVNIFDTRFDPTTQDINDQPLFIHRILKPKDWVLKRTGPGVDKPFDPKQVEKAISGGDVTIAQQQQDIYDELGITPGPTQDPMYMDAVELWECWRLDDEYPFKVILNRKESINKDPRRTPFIHGQNSITPLRNVILPGQFLGISEMQQPEALYYEMMALRNLRLDAATLATLPIFTRLREMGLPELKRKLTPGAIIDVTRQDGIQQLVKMAIPPEIFREMSEIKAEVDETNATFGNVRGQQATVNRVSATEQQSRLTQALTRMKTSAISFEEQIDPLIKQMLVLWYQLGNPETRLAIGGDSEDAMIALDKEKLLQALDYDFKFRGATRAINREQTVQQLIMFAEKFAALMAPEEGRFLMKQIYETLGLKGMQSAVKDENTKLLQEGWSKKMQLAEAQEEQQLQQFQLAQAQAPAEVSPDQAQALMAHMQGGADQGQGQGQPPAPAGAEGQPQPPPQGAPPAQGGAV